MTRAAPEAQRCSGLDRADPHPKAAFDLAEKPGGELLVGGVLFFDHFQHLVVNMSEQLQKLAIVDSPHLLHRCAGPAVAQMIIALGQKKKRPLETASAFPLSGSDVVMLDLCDVGRVDVAPATAGQQVVDHQDDCHDQQQEHQVACDVQGEAKEPENEQNDDDCPNQTSQSSPPVQNGQILLPNSLQRDYHL